MLNLQLIETFVATATAGSFSAAGKVLGITPAMVGRRIQMLEQAYGLTLIERTTRAQRLTEAGDVLLRRAADLLDEVADLDRAMRTAPTQIEGRVRMTGPATLGVYRLAGTIARFCEAHPLVTVETTLADRRADLIAEGFDFAVRIGEMHSSSMVARRVGTYRLSLVAAPAFVAQHGRPDTPADLRQMRCLINLNMTPRNRWPFRRGAETSVADVAGQLQIDNGEALRAAAREGVGIAYLPTDLVRDDLTTGRLERLLPQWETTSMPIWLVHPGRRVPFRVQALMDAIANDLRISHPF